MSAVATPTAAAPIAATRAPASPQSPTLGTFSFVADLRSANEVPPISDAEASCVGQGRLVLRARLDAAGQITMATAQVSVTVTGCPDGTTVALIRVHQSAAGLRGAVSIDSGLSAKDPVAMASDGIGVNVEGIEVSELAIVRGIIATPDAYYINVSSLSHLDGVVRGQLRYER